LKIRFAAVASTGRTVAAGSRALLQLNVDDDISGKAYRVTVLKVRLRTGGAATKLPTLICYALNAKKRIKN
jgi:hypothetical protein